MAAIAVTRSAPPVDLIRAAWRRDESRVNEAARRFILDVSLPLGEDAAARLRPLGRSCSTKQLLWRSYRMGGEAMMEYRVEQFLAKLGDRLTMLRDRVTA